MEENRKIKICVLDGFTLNPGDLSWKGFETFGEVTVYERTAPEQIVERARDYEIVIINKIKVTRELLDQLPKLKYLGVLATGYNAIDIEAARERGIVVTNITAYGNDSVAQMVFAHILNITQHVAYYAAKVNAGEWERSRDFCFWDIPLVELSGKNLGIVGLGQIGMAVARLAIAFGMNVYAVTSKKAEELPHGIVPVGFEELCRHADFITLHCPLTDSTREIINAHTISQMKKGVAIINTGRGQLINENALADALRSGHVAAAGLDVLSVEPPTEDNPLLRVDNCFITPHLAWATREARSRLMDIAVENLRQYLAGEEVRNRVC